MAEETAQMSERLKSAARALAAEIEIAHLLEFTAEQFTIVVRDPSNTEVSLQVFRDPLVIVQNLYGQLMAIDVSEDANPSLADQKSTIRRYIKPLIDNEEFTYVISSTVAHAIVSCYRSDENDKANAITEIFMRSKTLNSYLPNVMSEVYNITQSNERFDPEMIVSPNTPETPPDDTEEEEVIDEEEDEQEIEGEEAPADSVKEEEKPVDLESLEDDDSLDSDTEEEEEN